MPLTTVDRIYLLSGMSHQVNIDHLLENHLLCGKIMKPIGDSRLENDDSPNMSLEIVPEIGND